MQENNPSVRFYCIDKETLDMLLANIDEARKLKHSNPSDRIGSITLGTTLEQYLAFRLKTKCEGCKKGEKNCSHWSPENVEVNRS